MTERTQNYTAEFKRDAVKLVTEQGYAIAEAARIEVPRRKRLLLTPPTVQ